ncbi:hypothetical protein [Streptacidiphilus sp. PAMC 29251]
MQLVLTQGQGDDVDGDRDRREGARVVGGEPRLLVQRVLLRALR